MCDLDVPLNGSLLHASTLCILTIPLDDDLQWSRKDEQEEVQDDGEDDQEKIQEDGQGEDEEGGEASLAGLQPGLGRLPGWPHARVSRPLARTRPAPRPAACQI